MTSSCKDLNFISYIDHSQREKLSWSWNMLNFFNFSESTQQIYFMFLNNTYRSSRTVECVFSFLFALWQSTRVLSVHCKTVEMGWRLGQSRTHRDDRIQSTKRERFLGQWIPDLKSDFCAAWNRAVPFIPIFNLKFPLFNISGSAHECSPSERQCVSIADKRKFQPTIKNLSDFLNLVSLFPHQILAQYLKQASGQLSCLKVSQKQIA